MYTSNKIFFLISIILILTGCNSKQPSGSDNKEIETEYKIHYAKGFQVKKFTDYTEVSVINPWDTTQLLQKYILIEKGREIPSNIPKGIIVRIPLSKAAVFNTIQCSGLKELGVTNIIKGVCEPNYINLPEIQNGIANGTIIDLGQAANSDAEKLIMLSPDAILVSPISGKNYGGIEKTKIPIIETPDYTEPHPLGRAEWLRFYSLFVGKEHLADSLFNITVDNYNKIKLIAMNATNSPTVFTDTKYMGSWNMPGGKSYMANMLADAGGTYMWADNNSHTFLPLTFEAVLDKAGQADIWIIKYNAPSNMTYASLEKEYKPYSHFKAFKNNNVYECNTFHSNYYEDLPIHPDYVLNDLAYIFHPELFPNYTLKYYKKLTE